MVEVSEIGSLEEIKDEQNVPEFVENDDEYTDEEDDNVADKEDLAEIDSDDDIENESFIERILALQDAIPLGLRKSVSQTIASTYKVGKSVFKFASSGLWVAATGATILILPLAMEIEKEQGAIAQESQMVMQQQQVQQSVGDKK